MDSRKSTSYIIRPFFASAILAFTFVLAGCSKNSNNPVNSQGTSTVQGQVSGQPGLAKSQKLMTPDGGIQGASVTVAQIQLDGSLKTVSTAAVQTDASGHFSVRTDLDGVSNLIVVASHGTTQWEAVVSSEVKNGTTVDCQPLTNQTTVQAETYSRIVADGKSSEVMPADLQLFISSTVAANVAGNTGAMAQLAAALEAHADAWTIAPSQFNVTQTQVQTAVTAREQAQMQFESALYSAAGDSTEDNSALETYFTETLGAYVAAGIPLEVIAKIEEIACSAMTNSTATMSAGAQFSVAQSAALVRAGLIGEAVVSKLQEGGATQSEIASADSANTAILVAIEQSVSSRNISAAFAGYHAAIIACLEAMAGNQASAVGTIDNDINVAGGAHALLMNSLDAAATTGAVVQAYMTYYGSINTMMHGMSGMSSAQLDAATQILMLINSNN